MRQSAGMFDRDPPLEGLPVGRLIQDVTNPAKSVPLRGRAILEVGRRAENEPALQSQLAEWITSHDFRHRRWVGTITLAWVAACSLAYSLRRSESSSLLAGALSQWPSDERALLLKWARNEDWFVGIVA